MDALARLEPVARDLMSRVDAALVTLGAPPHHPVWPLVRRLGTTPADAVAFLIEVDAGALRDAATALRRQADAYEAAEVPTDLPWRGSAGDAYAARSADLRRHLAGDGSMAGGSMAGGSMTGGSMTAGSMAGGSIAGGSMADRLRDTAACADDVADWYARSRNRLARTLAEVLTSAQAVAVRARSTPGAEAADIGARVLSAVAAAVVDGEAVHRRWRPALGQLPFRRGVETPTRLDATIEVGPA
jgi:hypothetical protein